MFVGLHCQMQNTGLKLGMCIRACMCACACMTCLWRPEDNVQKSVLSWPVSSGDEFASPGCSTQLLYSLWHLAPLLHPFIQGELLFDFLVCGTSG